MMMSALCGMRQLGLAAVRQAWGVVTAAVVVGSHPTLCMNVISSSDFPKRRMPVSTGIHSACCRPPSSRRRGPEKRRREGWINETVSSAKC